MEQNAFTQNTENEPKVRTYLNPINFLNDYFNFRKGTHPSFSFELWSTELGFKSKASIRMICQGKRQITDKFLNALCKQENYDQLEKDYLYLLSYYHKLKSVTLKKSILEKLIEKYDLNHAQSHIKNHIEFLSSNELPVLQLLISFKDFKATESNLSLALNVNSKKLTEHLKVLENLDLIQKIDSEASEEKYWVSKNKLFRIPDEASDPVLALFHQETMKEALGKAAALSQSTRFRSLYFSLSEEKFNEISNTLNDIANRIKVEHCNNFIQNKKLYKLNFQLYPVTDTIND